MSEHAKRNYGTTDDPDPSYADEGYASSDTSSEDIKATHGVKTIEAISQVWTSWSLFVAYFG